MTTPFWCLFATALLPYFIAPVGAYFRVRQFGVLETKNPRKQQAETTGIAARANAAQANAWEALPLFASAVIVAHLANADPGTAAMLSVIFVSMRILHAVFYITDIDKMRSLVFLVAFACCIGLFISAARA